MSIPRGAWVLVVVAMMLVPVAVLQSPLKTPSTGAAASANPPAPGAREAASDPGGSWTTYMDNIKRTGDNAAETAIGASNVSELQPVWTVPSNGSDFSAAIVVNGTVYYGSWNGDEYAVNGTTGAILWQTYLGTDTACGGYTPMGISSTPAFADGTLYLGGGNGSWYALNATTGGVDWSILPGSTGDGYYAWASGLVYDGSLYVATSSCFDNPLVPAGLLEVSLSGDHNITAEFNTSPPGQIGESIWTTPAIDPATNTLWVTTGNEQPPAYPPYANAIIGLNATTLAPLGSWQVPNVEGQDSDFGSTPTLFRTAAGVPMIVASNKNGVAYALNRSNVSVNGTWFPAWNLSTGGGFSGAAFDGSTLYLAGGSTVYAVDPSNGSVLWTAPMVGGGYITGSLSVANGVVYAGGGSTVEAVDAANGTALWSSPLPFALQTVTEPVVVGDQLFVASGDYSILGAMTAFALEPYTVAFTETGLPTGKPWTVSVGGVSQSSLGSTLDFYEPNGSFSYLVQGPSGFAVQGVAPSGTVNVSGANVSEAFSFAKGRTYSVSFDESGLPNGFGWCAGLAGRLTCRDRGSIVLHNLTPAEYPYTIASETGFVLTVKLHRSVVLSSGEVSLTRGGATLSAKFALSEVAVTFEETGLPAGHRWSVQVRGIFGSRTRSESKGTSGSSVSFDLPNGTFLVAIHLVGHYTGTGPGSVTVNGTPVQVNLTFTPETERAGVPGGPPVASAAAAGRPEPR